MTFRSCPLLLRPHSGKVPAIVIIVLPLCLKRPALACTCYASRVNATVGAFLSRCHISGSNQGMVVRVIRINPFMQIQPSSVNAIHHGRHLMRNKVNKIGVLLQLMLIAPCPEKTKSKKAPLPPLAAAWSQGAASTSPKPSTCCPNANQPSCVSGNFLTSSIDPRSPIPLRHCESVHKHALQRILVVQTCFPICSSGAAQ